MNDDFPSDGDGDALRRLRDDGSDLSKPMLIDFQVAVPDEESGTKLAEICEKLGYKARVYSSSECSLPWTCECSTRMVPSYDAIIAIQEELAGLASKFDGFPDGWGSFGNGDE